MRQGYTPLTPRTPVSRRTRVTSLANAGTTPPGCTQSGRSLTTVHGPSPRFTAIPFCGILPSPGAPIAQLDQSVGLRNRRSGVRISLGAPKNPRSERSFAAKRCERSPSPWRVEEAWKPRSTVPLSPRCTATSLGLLRRLRPGLSLPNARSGTWMPAASASVAQVCIKSWSRMRFSFDSTTGNSQTFDTRSGCSGSLPLRPSPTLLLGHWGVPF